MPRNRSGWALGTLSTGGVGGALIGPLIGGLLADLYGLRPVFYITAAVLFVCFVLTLLYVKSNSPRYKNATCCMHGRCLPR